VLSSRFGPPFPFTLVRSDVSIHFSLISTCFAVRSVQLLHLFFFFLRLRCWCVFELSGTLVIHSGPVKSSEWNLYRKPESILLTVSSPPSPEELITDLSSLPDGAGSPDLILTWGPPKPRIFALSRPRLLDQSALFANLFPSQISPKCLPFPIMECVLHFLYRSDGPRDLVFFPGVL